MLLLIASILYFIAINLYGKTFNNNKLAEKILMVISIFFLIANILFLGKLITVGLLLFTSIMLLVKC